jgi:hypothetical protein
MVKTKHSGCCSTVVIKTKNEKHLILFLRTLKFISGNFRVFFIFILGATRKFSELPSADQRKTRDHFVWVFCDVTPWNLADKYKSS